MDIIRRHGRYLAMMVVLLTLATFQPPVLSAEVSDLALTERVVRGESIGAATAQLTGTAINPLFGVTVLGMYHYFSTPEHLRDQLPLYDQPYVWGILLLIMLLMFFNSTLCETMPFLKIPLNALGDMVNKGGAVVVLPIVLHEFAQAATPTAAATLVAASEMIIPTVYAGGGMATLVASVCDGWMFFGWAVALIVGLFAYAVVWMVWNVVDVIILVLPIPCLDAMLKSIRLGAATCIFGLAALNPWLGLVAALVMILVCWYLAGWAFRLSVMGFVFATDFLLWRKPGNIDADAGIPAFITATAAKQWKCPARSYGRLRREPDKTLCFVWRPWLVGSLRKIDLGSSENFHGGSTLLYPVLLGSTGNNPLFRFPPRYRSDSQAVTDTLGLYGCRDISIVRGIWTSIRQFFRTGEVAGV